MLSHTKEVFYFGTEVNQINNGGIVLKPHEKYNLSVKEAAAYFGLGEKKIRWIVEMYPENNLALMNGSHVLIKRVAFEKFIDTIDSI